MRRASRYAFKRVLPFQRLRALGLGIAIEAMGQVYVLISRVTDPRNMLLIGLPPKDMLEDIAQALVENGLDPDEVFERACNVTQEWEYDRSATLLRNRFKQRYVSEKTVPLKHRRQPTKRYLAFIPGRE